MVASKSSLLILLFAVTAETSVHAFAPVTGRRTCSIRMATTEQENKSDDSSFVPLENAPDDDDTFAKVEQFGRGSAKVRRFEPFDSFTLALTP